jgi:tetratricopeptide (TPR) repeat protein/predicted aspartyl protease
MDENTGGARARAVKEPARRRGIARTGAAAAALAALALLAPARGTAAGCKLSAMELPVTLLGSRALATVGINGTEVRLVVDSGSFYSFLTEAAVAQLKLPLSRAPRGLRVQGLTGDVDIHMTTVKELALLKGQVPDVDFIVGGNEPGAGAAGLMGRNLLTFTDTEYDFAHGMIRFMFPSGDCAGHNMAYWAGETPVSMLPLRRDEDRLPAIKATAKLNGKEITVLFDSGATSAISLAAALRSGVAQADMKPDGTMRGMGQAATKAWIAPIHQLELGGESIENNHLEVGDFQVGDIDMLLGIDFFLSHRIYVSKSQRRVYFTYNGGPVFARNTVSPADAAASGAAGDGGDEPADAAGYARRGAAFAARRDYGRALADFDRACAMAPRDAALLTRRGQLREEMKQWPQALQDFEAALRLDAGQADARMQRALLRANAADRDGALADLQVLDAALAPQAHMRLQMAQLYALLDLPERALPQWDLWVPSHRKEAGLDAVLNARCWARAMLGVELDKALDDCDEAIDLEPKNAAYRDSRGWVRLRRGDLRRAVSDFDRSLELQPDGAWSLYGRGIARTRQGDAEQGRADIAAARKLLPAIDEQAGRHGLAAER